MLLVYSKVNLQIHTLSDLSSLLTIALSGLALSVPIGFVIHESDVLLYREVYRRFRDDYAWMNVIRGYFRVRPRTEKFIGKEHYQALLEFVKFTNQQQANTHLEGEVSNRWSYFYARLEAGLYAPAFAVVLSWITIRLFRLPTVLSVNRLVAGAIAIIVISVLLVGYCPRLMKEIDAIETLTVLQSREIRALILYLRLAGWVEREDT
jgi:hypothetical protein